MKITPRVNYKRHPRFRDWIAENRLGLAVELEQVGDSLTEWTGKFYVRDSDDKIMTEVKEDGLRYPVMEYRKVTTTPAERRWLGE